MTVSAKAKIAVPVLLIAMAMPVNGAFARASNAASEVRLEAGQDRSRPVQPVQRGRWAQQVVGNYPSMAVREQLQGRVVVTVSVDRQGNVLRCTVSQSSGHRILDEAACNGMLKFARFLPALDAAGNPVEGSYTTGIDYRLN